MRQLVAISVLVACVGCTETKTVPTAPASTQPTTVAPETPSAAAPNLSQDDTLQDPPETTAKSKAVPKVESAQDKRIREFKEKVSEYLAEARAGAKLLALGPSLSQARKKAEQITDLYTHLPDVPVDVPKHETVAKRLKNINGSFAVAEATVQLQIQAASLNSAELIEKTRSSIEMIAKDIKAFCSEIEMYLATK